jgi:hypothetical protein
VQGRSWSRVAGAPVAWVRRFGAAVPYGPALARHLPVVLGVALAVLAVAESIMQAGSASPLS